CLYLLGQSPYLGNVTVFRTGEPVEPDITEPISVGGRCRGYLHVVRRMPRLEELYRFARADNLPELFALPTLTHLRVLQLYHQHKFHLKGLAENRACGNLTTLLCHSANYGGGPRPHLCLTMEDLRAVCRSRTLKSLTHLSLRLTFLGDEACE